MYIVHVSHEFKYIHNCAIFACLPACLSSAFYIVSCYRMVFFPHTHSICYFVKAKKMGSYTRNKATKGFYKPFICNDVWLQSYFNREKVRETQDQHEKKKKTTMVMMMKKETEQSVRRQLVTLSSSNFIWCRTREILNQTCIRIIIVST